MDGRKCKISLFCVQFVVFFFVGTICGVLIFRFGAKAKSEWLLAYGQAMSHMVRQQQAYDTIRWLRPLFVAGILAVVPWKKPALTLVVSVRGCLMAYTVCLFYGSGQSCLFLVLRSLILLPVFFLVCYGSWHGGYVG